MQNHLDSIYISTNEANKLISDNCNDFKFSTICINARSIVNPNNFSKVEAFVSALNHTLHIIAINETWERPGKSGQYQNLKDYNFVSNPRKLSKGGGVGLYIKKDVVFSVVSELTIMNEQIFESLFIVVHFETKSIICGTIYKSPKIDALSVSEFFDDLKFVLSELKKI